MFNDFNLKNVANSLEYCMLRKLRGDIFTSLCHAERMLLLYVQQTAPGLLKFGINLNYEFQKR